MAENKKKITEYKKKDFHIPDWAWDDFGNREVSKKTPHNMIEEQKNRWKSDILYKV